MIDNVNYVIGSEKRLGWLLWAEKRRIRRRPARQTDTEDDDNCCLTEDPTHPDQVE